MLGIGSALGYYTRQSLARKRAGTIEAKLQKKLIQVKKEAAEITDRAQEKASHIVERAKKDVEAQKREFFEAETTLLKREKILGERIAVFDDQEKEARDKLEKLKTAKETLENLREEAVKGLERVSGLSKEDAKKELLENIEREYQQEISEKMRRLNNEGEDRYKTKAKEILAQAIQRLALPQTHELTTTIVSIPSDDIKGRIIGKEGRNIKTLEKLTGVEVIVDDTPEAVVISGFDPVRRQIAKIALEKLIRDGRIQPARIEEMVERAKEEIDSAIKEAGEKAVYEAGIVGLDPRVIQILGRLRFRTSYGQNALFHALEVSYLAGLLAEEIGANVTVAKKAGLLHDIGKAVDHQIKGSHVEIGIRILEKFGVEKEVVDAMKSHHEEYPVESVEAVIVQTADQISGARPGARKDNLEQYIKRLEDLENIATAFGGVEKAYAIQAGREIRVFVNPQAVDDFGSAKIARQVANKIQEELRYPGEIKVIVIRENRVIEYAR